MLRWRTKSIDHIDLLKFRRTDPRRGREPERGHRCRTCSSSRSSADRPDDRRLAGDGIRVTSSTLLIAAGIAPASASAAVHLSEIGTTLVSGISHHKLGNVDWRTVRIIAIPGAIGGFAGATILSSIDGDLAKPWVALLLLGLGAYVTWRFFVLGGRRPSSGQVSGLLLAPLGWSPG
jgi:hypothetical protein